MDGEIEHACWKGGREDWCGHCRLGVLVEVNCETDFVARGDQFRELVSDIAMQIAACDVSVVAAEDAPADEVERERAIEMQKEDIQSKPEAIRCAEPSQQHLFPICEVEGTAGSLASAMATGKEWRG